MMAYVTMPAHRRRRGAASKSVRVRRILRSSSANKRWMPDTDVRAAGLASISATSSCSVRQVVV